MNIDLSLMQRGLGVVGNVGSLWDGEAGPGGVEVEGQRGGEAVDGVHVRVVLGQELLHPHWPARLAGGGQTGRTLKKTCGHGPYILCRIS